MKSILYKILRGLIILVPSVVILIIAVTDVIKSHSADTPLSFSFCLFIADFIAYFAIDTGSTSNKAILLIKNVLFYIIFAAELLLAIFGMILGIPFLGGIQGAIESDGVWAATLYGALSLSWPLKYFLYKKIKNELLLAFVPVISFVAGYAVALLFGVFGGSNDFVSYGIPLIIFVAAIVLLCIYYFKGKRFFKAPGKNRPSDIDYQSGDTKNETALLIARRLNDYMAKNLPSYGTCTYTCLSIIGATVSYFATVKPGTYFVDLSVDIDFYMSSQNKNESESFIMQCKRSYVEHVKTDLKFHRDEMYDVIKKAIIEGHPTYNGKYGISNVSFHTN